MTVLEEGQAKVMARSRLMTLLGEQLISDEVAAVSELVKNSYDADAEEVIVKLQNVSDSNKGKIVIKDKGHGMTLQTVISSWLELGTLSKARGADKKARFSEFKGRVLLGEKGVGRLAVHKLGEVTELVTRRVGEDVETKVKIDWTSFEHEGFLDDVPVPWEVTEPEVFTESSEYKNGTRITITNLREDWTTGMMKRVKENILALTSPFKKISDFKIIVDIEDENAPEFEVPDMSKIVKKAMYTFTGNVDKTGKITYDYKFERTGLVDLNREWSDTVETKTLKWKPSCGPFKFQMYAWSAHRDDQEAIFGDTSIYRRMIRPNSGIKVFRDDFRVYPYGNTDDDWLSMDDRRIKRFEEMISRNQILGIIEISSKTNPELLDKTDREGLIDNQAFKDFKRLILQVLTTLEAERIKDFRKLKEVTGRIKAEDADKAIYTRNLATLSKAIWNQDNLPAEVKLSWDNLVKEARDSLHTMISDKEKPLIVAASYGITYLIPTHEAKRGIDEALKILRWMRKKEKLDLKKLNTAISYLAESSKITKGLAKLALKSEEKTINLKKVAEKALTYMEYKFERNNIRYSVEGPESLKAKANENLIIMMLLNFLDNSFYWLLRKKLDEREVKIIVGDYYNRPMIIVSDSGPGFKDSLDVITLPFFTRKPDGMGLGLHIAERIAKMNGGYLKMFNEIEIPGLLSGANIGAILQKVEH